MAQELRHFAVSVPASTAIASPQTTALTMPARLVRGVRIRVPPGPAGNVGFALASGGVAVLPWNAGAWIVADNEIMEWELDRQIESGAWQLVAYNLGVYAHSLYLTFYLDLPQVAATPLGPMPLDLST